MKGEAEETIGPIRERRSTDACVSNLSPWWRNWKRDQLTSESRHEGCCTLDRQGKDTQEWMDTIIIFFLLIWPILALRKWQNWEHKVIPTWNMARCFIPVIYRIAAEIKTWSVLSSRKEGQSICSNVRVVSLVGYSIRWYWKERVNVKRRQVVRWLSWGNSVVGVFVKIKFGCWWEICWL